MGVPIKILWKIYCYLVKPLTQKAYLLKYSKAFAQYVQKSIF